MSRMSPCRLAWLILTRSLLLYSLAAFLLLSVTVLASDAPPDVQYTLASWTERDGLPANFILTIRQDSEGYLWVATSGGVARFDGTKFSRWSASDELSEAGPIRAMSPARDGSLWIATPGMVGVVREHDGHVTKYTPQHGLPAGFVTSLLEAKDGAIWAGGTAGLARFRDERWEEIPLGPHSRKPSVNAIFEGSRGDLLICTSSGIIRHTSQMGSPPLDARYSGVPCNSIAQDTGGQIWFTDYRGDLRTLNGPMPAPGSNVQIDMNGPALLVDRRENLWVASRANGLIRISKNSDGSRKMASVFTDKEGLAGKLVRALFEDREGNVWVGTDQGLTRVSPSLVMSLSSGDQAVNAIARAGNDIWLGTSSGLIRLSNERQTNFTSRDGLPHGEVNALYADEHGGLWIGTATGGVAVVANNGFRVLALRGDIQPRRLRAMTLDRRGTLWLADDERGLFRWKNGTLRAFEVPLQLRNNEPRAAFTDSRGRVWFGFSLGNVGMYDGDRFAVYSTSDGLPRGAVNAMCEDDVGTIWLATNAGLSYFANGRFVTRNFVKGLSARRIASMIADETGSIWLGISTGVLRIDRSEIVKALGDNQYRLHGRLYDATDGIRGSLMSRGYPHIVREPNGMLWFATTSGVAVFDTRRLSETRWTAPRVAIESVTIDDYQVKSGPTLQLTSRPAMLQFTYTALSLGAPTKLRFRHILEGVEDQWVDDGSNRQVTYAHLGPGKYRFRVAATSGDDIWDERNGVVEFTIPPAFFQTKRFYVASAGLVCLLVIGGWLWRERQIRRQFAFVLAERARVSRELHDTLLQSLVGVVLQLRYISSQLAPSSEYLKQELGRMRAQVEYYIREAQESIRDLRSPRSETGDLASALRRAGEHVTTGEPVVFELALCGVPQPIPARVQQELVRIAHEAMTNAVRHGHPTQVQVELAFSRNAVRVRISDDGCGFDPDATNDNGQGHWGIQIMRERAAQINGTMTISSAAEHGTSIEVMARLA